MTLYSTGSIGLGAGMGDGVDTGTGTSASGQKQHGQRILSELVKYISDLCPHKVPPFLSILVPQMDKNYLHSWLQKFHGVGPSRASNYLERVGGTWEDVAEDLDNGGAILRQVLKNTNYTMIIRAFFEEEHSPFHQFLVSTCGVPSHRVKEVPNTYPMEIRMNPFQHLHKVLTTQAMDTLFINKFGGATDAPCRVAYLTKLSLNNMKNNDMYMPLETFMKEVKFIISRSALCDLDKNEVAFVVNGDVYKRSNYLAECELPGMICQTHSLRQDVEFDFANDRLDEHQFRALRRMKEGGFVCISGGAGSGKTEVVKAFCDFCDTEDVLILAFTGAAAKNAERRVKHVKALTIDSFIASSGSEKHDEMYANLRHVIIDEASMVASSKLHKLMRILPLSTNIYMMGDPNQLPPIGQGEPFRDLCDIEEFTVTLLGNHRQEHQNEVQVLRGISNGQWPEESVGNIHIHTITKNTDGFMALEVLDVIQNAYDDDTQFIACTNKVCDVMNNIIQPLANPNVRKEFSVGTRVYSTTNAGSFTVLSRDGSIYTLSNNYGVKFKKHRHEIRPMGFVDGDRVVLTKNHHDKRVVNGSVGIVERLDDDKRVCVRFGETLVKINADELKHAYCMTVHKMQGQEKPRIVFLAWKLLPDCDRRLLYSACTRFTQELHVFYTSHWWQVSKFVAQNVKRTKSRVLNEIIRILNEQD